MGHGVQRIVWKQNRWPAVKIKTRKHVDIRPKCIQALFPQMNCLIVKENGRAVQQAAENYSKSVSKDKDMAFVLCLLYMYAYCNYIHLYAQVPKLVNIQVL